jgi:YggT family protein
MFVFGNFLDAVAGVLNTLLTLYTWVILARVVVSWISADRYNPIVRTICNLTDPLLDRLRRSFPMSVGGIDLSPVVAILIIWFLQQFLVQSLYDLARSM